MSGLNHGLSTAEPLCGRHGRPARLCSLCKDLAHDPQPMPIPNDGPSCHDLAIEGILARKEFGLEKYGTLLQPDNGRDFLQDAFDEVLDAVCYLAGAMAERDSG